MTRRTTESPRPQPAWREVLIVAVLFAALGIAATWPLASAPAQHSVSGRANNDVFLNQYLIFWGAHALSENPTALYHTNMFHPARYAFAYADMLLSNSVVLYPVIRIFYDPTLTYNVLLLLSIIAGGTGFFVLARLFVESRVAQLVGALLFVFNPGHFVRYRQPQFFFDDWLPWFLWALLIWLWSCGAWRPLQGARGEAPAKPLRWAVLAALLFCLHAQTGSHNAVFGLLVGSAVGAYYLGPAAWAALRKRPQLWGDASPRQALNVSRTAIGVLVMVVIGIVILLPAFYPYFVVQDWLLSQRIGGPEAAERSLEFRSAGLQELLTGDSRLYAWMDERFGWPSAYVNDGMRLSAHLFPGVTLPLLFLVGLAAIGSIAVPGHRRHFGAWLVDGAVVAVLCGTALAWSRAPEYPWLRALPTIWIAPLAMTVLIGLRNAVWPDTTHLLTLVGRLARIAQQRRPHLFFWTALALVLFLAALGPAFGVYPILRFLPGVELIRAPSRFLLPALFAASMVAAWGTQRLVQHGGRARTGLIVLLMWFALEANFAPLPTVPPPYGRNELTEWLAEQPDDFAILEIPIDLNPTAATRQMFESVFHWKTLLVGYSGSAPPGYSERMERLATGFPDDPTLDELERLDVRYVVVLHERLNATEVAAIEAQPRLRFIDRLAGRDVFQLGGGGS